MKKTKTKKTKNVIEYGLIDQITDEDILPKNVRVSITLRIPEETLSFFKSESKKHDMGYQTLMINILNRYKDMRMPSKSTYENHLSAVGKDGTIKKKSS